MNEGRRVHFDPTINLGHIITAAVFLVTAAAAWMSMDARMALAERDIKGLQGKDSELARDHEKAVVGAETRLMVRINDERARLDQTQVRTADDIREMKQIMRDGFRDLDVKLERKVDKPGR